MRGHFSSAPGGRRQKEDTAKYNMILLREKQRMLPLAAPPFLLQGALQNFSIAAKILSPFFGAPPYAAAIPAHGQPKKSALSFPSPFGALTKIRLGRSGPLPFRHQLLPGYKKPRGSKKRKNATKLKQPGQRRLPAAGPVVWNLQQQFPRPAPLKGVTFRKAPPRMARRYAANAGGGKPRPFYAFSRSGNAMIFLGHLVAQMPQPVHFA